MKKPPQKLRRLEKYLLGCVIFYMLEIICHFRVDKSAKKPRKIVQTGDMWGLISFNRDLSVSTSRQTSLEKLFKQGICGG